jgi:hypothetical protein
MDPRDAFQMTSMLRGVVDGGTGRVVRDMGVDGPIAGKTGTTNDGADTWFVGYTPVLVAGFCSGTTRHVRSAVPASGARMAAPAWVRFYRDGWRERGYDWPVPDGLVSATIDAQTARLRPSGARSPRANGSASARSPRRSARSITRTVAVVDREPRRRDRGAGGRDPQAVAREELVRTGRLQAANCRLQAGALGVVPICHRDLQFAICILSLDAIARASRDIDPVFRATPQFEADALGRPARGAYPAEGRDGESHPLLQGTRNRFLPSQRRYRLPRRLVTASAGNFGQGLAYAARSRGVALDVFAAESANPKKVARMRELGAAVHLAGRDFDDAKAPRPRLRDREGVSFVEDGREPAIAEGAGRSPLSCCTGRNRLPRCSCR